MSLDYPIGSFTVGSLIVIVPALIGGWFLMRDRIRMLAAQQTGTIAALQRSDEGGA